MKQNRRFKRLVKGVICHAGIKLWDTWWAENADLNRV